jgi:hypothetical protein
MKGGGIKAKQGRDKELKKQLPHPASIYSPLPTRPHLTSSGLAMRAIIRALNWLRVF